MTNLSKTSFTLLVIAAILGYFLWSRPTGVRHGADVKKYEVMVDRLSKELKELKGTFGLLYSSPLRVVAVPLDKLVNRPVAYINGARKECSEAEIYLRKALKAQRKVDELNTYYQSLLRQSKTRAKLHININKIIMSITTKVPVDEALRLERKKDLTGVAQVLGETIAEKKRYISWLTVRFYRAVAQADRDLKYAILVVTLGVVGGLLGLVGLVWLGRFSFVFLTGVKDYADETAIRMVAGGKYPGFVRLKPAKDGGELSALLEEEKIKSKTGETLAGILNKYREWPASIGGHDRGEGGLIRHTRCVVKRMLSEDSGLDREEVAVCGLAHDIGKILLYKKKEGVWSNDIGYHDAYSVSILRGIEAFFSEFPREARERIINAIYYHHCPKKLPLNAPKGTRELLSLLCRADELCAREGKGKANGGGEVNRDGGDAKAQSKEED